MSKNIKEKENMIVTDKVNYLFKVSHRQSKHMIIRGFLSSRFSEEDVKDELISWCESFSFWSHGESFISYSYKPIKIPSRKSLLKKWTDLCKRKDDINEEHEMMRMQLLHAK